MMHYFEPVPVDKCEKDKWLGRYVVYRHPPSVTSFFSTRRKVTGMSAHEMRTSLTVRRQLFLMLDDGIGSASSEYFVVDE